MRPLLKSVWAGTCCPLILLLVLSYLLGQRHTDCYDCRENTLHSRHFDLSQQEKHRRCGSTAALHTVPVIFNFTVNTLLLILLFGELPTLLSLTLDWISKASPLISTQGSPRKMMQPCAKKFGSGSAFSTVDGDIIQQMSSFNQSRMGMVRTRMLMGIGSPCQHEH